MLRTPLQGTNQEQITWRCWDEPIAAHHKQVTAHWAACYPSALPGAALKLLRECIGVTRFDLAGYLGISERRVARWENGKPGTDALADRTLRVLYLNSVGDRSTLDDIKALLDITQTWPQWVTLEKRPYGWRATRYGDLQAEAAPTRQRKTRGRAKPVKRLGLRLVA